MSLYSLCIALVFIGLVLAVIGYAWGLSLLLVALVLAVILYVSQRGRY